MLSDPLILATPCVALALCPEANAPEPRRPPQGVAVPLAILKRALYLSDVVRP